MIMLTSQHPELREQPKEALQDSGHEVAIPAHRETMLAMLKDIQPSLIVLDLHLSDPSGTEGMRMIRARGYAGKVIASVIAFCIASHRVVMVSNFAKNRRPAHR